MKSKFLYVSPNKGKAVYKEYENGRKVKLSKKELVCLLRQKREL